MPFTSIAPSAAGHIESYSAVWSETRLGTGTLVANESLFGTSVGTFLYNPGAEWECFQTFFKFDLSEWVAFDILSVKLEVQGSSAPFLHNNAPTTRTFGLVVRDNVFPLSIADWIPANEAGLQASFVSSMDASQIMDGVTYVWPGSAAFDAAVASALAGDGILELAMLPELFFDSSAPPHANDIDYWDVGVPSLVIEHETPAILSVPGKYLDAQNYSPAIEIRAYRFPVKAQGVTTDDDWVADFSALTLLGRVKKTSIPDAPTRYDIKVPQGERGFVLATAGVADRNDAPAEQFTSGATGRRVKADTTGSAPPNTEHGEVRLQDGAYDELIPTPTGSFNEGRTIVWMKRKNPSYTSALDGVDDGSGWKVLADPSVTPDFGAINYSGGYHISQTFLFFDALPAAAGFPMWGGIVLGSDSPNPGLV